MSSSTETAYFMELQPGDAVQDGDQWMDSFGQWQPYVCAGHISEVVFAGVKARRPIRTTHQTTYEEVPGSRTTQDTVVQPHRERIAYEELQPGDIIQEGDEWQNECGRWQSFLVLDGSRVQVRQSQRVRRPYNITRMQGERDEARKSVTQMMVQLTNQTEVLTEVRADEKRLFDDLELLRSEYVKLQNERDELKTALRESHAAHEFTMKQGLAACKERDEALAELAQAREGIQDLLKTIADNADQFAEHTTSLVKQRDGFDAEVQRLQEVVRNLYNEPTAKQVQDILRTWATELDWSAGCFDSVAREQIDTIQKTLVAVIERIETMLNPEGNTDGE